MFGFFKDLLKSLQGIAQALHVLAEVTARTSSDHVSARVEELERSRALWEGEMVGLVTKLESRFNSVRASEERTRALAKAAGKGREDEADEGTPDQAALEAYYRAYAGAGPANGVQPVPSSVDRGGKTAASARKWGRQ